MCLTQQVYTSLFTSVMANRTAAHQSVSPYCRPRFLWHLDVYKVAAKCPAAPALEVSRFGSQLSFLICLN